ncbi:MAG: phosphate/phosphite/phosphonate ABC transporter substrate-binding protein [Bacillota bacterium]
MRRVVPLLLVLLTLTSLLAGCGSKESHPFVRLHELDPTLAGGAQGISPRPVLRVGLSTMLSPRETLLRYGPLLDYLGRKLGRHVEVVLPRSHTEMVDLIRSGQVQVGFVSSYAYVVGQKEFGMEAVAVPVYEGKPSHRSLIIVRRYSGLERFADLKGHTFAYTDPLSASGRLFPEALVLGLGEAVDRFFDKTIFTSSDDKAIKALDQGLVDGAAVDSVMFDLAVLHDPDLARRIRVIEMSDPYGAPPLVVSPRLGYELKRQLREALVEMSDDEQGSAVLAGLYLDGFVVPEPAWFEPVTELAERVGVRR